MPTDARVLNLTGQAPRSQTGRELTLFLRGGPQGGAKLTTEVQVDGSDINTLDHRGYTYRDSGHCSNHGVPIFDWLPDTRPRAR